MNRYIKMNATDIVKNVVKQSLPRRSAVFLQAVVNRIQAFRSYTFSFPNASLPVQESAFPFPVAKENLLAELGTKYAASKRYHNYLIYYWLHFRDIRLDVKNVLEIGVQTDRSIRMWEEFFPNATIYGIDIDRRCKEFEGGRRRIFIGDQSDYTFLHQVLSEIRDPLDIVIDDGSHRPDHQLKTFDFLFPALSSHGIYVIEDTGGCVGDVSLRTINALKEIIDHIMYWPKGFVPENWGYLSKFSDETAWIDKNVIGIAFYRWIVFIMRGRNPEDNPFLYKADA
jgi:hypothetical protein